MIGNKQFIFSGEKYVPHTLFWEQEMANYFEPFQLKGDRLGKTEDGRASETILLDASTRAMLWRYAANRPLENFTIWASAVSMVLSRYTGNNNLAFLTPLENRIAGETQWESLVPVFLEILDDNSIREVILQVGARLKDFYRFQNFPLDLLSLPENKRTAPDQLSNVLLSYNEFHAPVEEEIGKRFFHIAVSSAGESDPVSIQFTYNTRVFSAEFVQQFAGHLLNLLKQFENIHQTISDCSLLSEEEEHQLLITFNNTDEPYPESHTIIDLFEKQATLQPNKIALIYDNSQMSYRELSEQSTQLANYLLKSGIKENELVAICMDRSLEMLIVMMGILKAGCAYVPMDPDYPHDRIQYLLADTGARFVITQSRHLGLFKGSANDLVLLDTDTIWPEVLEEPMKDLPVRVSPKHLAYVIYTSGSTGKPKGVMIGHRSLLVRLNGMIAVLGIEPGVKTCMWTNYVFDVSLLESFLALIAGACVQIPQKEDVYDTGRLIDLYQKTGVTHIQVTPSFLSNFIDALDHPQAKAMRLSRICSGGESLKKEQVIALQQKLPNVKISNHYGPTEATIDAIANRDIDTYETNIIGKPLPNTQVYIVDKFNKLVPVGVAGELLIGGETLALGYLNREALTSEKFIQNPFDPNASSRLYKSGDLARWLPGGNLEFLGRIDEQVKIRGFRVEPGEIETVLAGHKAVKACAVKAVPDARGELRLAAYVVPSALFDKLELQAYLSDLLPEYMMPSSWTELSELPVNANGKVDKKALPLPDFTKSVREYTAPRNQWEQLLADIWQDLLQSQSISIHDNFFELGGHSLLVMTLMSRIYAQTQIKVSLPEVFLNPELSALADILAAKSPESMESIPLADPVDGAGLYPLSDAQQQIWVIEQQQENAIGFVLPDFFRLRGNLNVAFFKTAFENIIRRHESLRTVFRTIDNQPYQFVLPFTELDAWMEFEDLQGVENRWERVEKTARKEEKTSFDLRKGPLIRLKLYRLETSEYVMLMTAHHIITDLKSTLILFEELIEGYNALVNNKAYEIRELPVQYKDYAAWQLNKKAKAGDKAYWLDVFEGFVPNQLLVPDFSRPKVKTYEGNTLYFRISPEQSAQLLEFCTRKGLSLYMTFFSILNFLFYRYTDQTDITIGSAVSEREHPDLEKQIGLFVNILALRNQIRKEATFGELLEGIRQRVLEAYKHQSFSFYELVNALQIPRASNRNPLFDVYLSVGIESLDQLGLASFSNIDMEPFLMDDTKSMHDLSVNFSQKGDYIEGALTYPVALYRPEKIEGLRDHILNVIQLITEKEQVLLDTVLSDIHYLSEPQQAQLLAFNPLPTPFPDDKTVVDLFEEQAAGRPDQIAVVFEEQEFTYREFNEAVNRLAHCLIEKGVKEESLVAICMERSAEMIIGIMAILKAGGAYVPIDPGYPAERINFMLKDSGYAVLIDAAFYEDFKSSSGQYPNVNPGKNPKVNNLYSVIYTSGSTGKPKGVLLEHQGLVNHIHNVKNLYYVTSDSRFLQFFNIGFDAAAEEIFTSLCFGATLCIRSEDELNPVRMLDLIRRRRITHADFSTAYFESFISSISPLDLEEKLVSCGIGGEKVNRSFIVKYREQLAAFTNRLFNVYGPTETTLTATIFNILEDDQLENRLNIPIGKPYPNRSIFILDNKGNLVPPGVYGELHIGGRGVSRGYLNRPELTSEKFISYLQLTGKPEKLYKTGDVACWLLDGNIEYSGRTDSQVKIRGYRIELGEIENKIRSHTAVEDAVVLCREKESAGKELVAYFVPSSQAGKTEPALNKTVRAFLKAELPEYMVPAILMEMKAFPLTRNGKVDKNALPNPDATAFLENEFVLPRTDIELHLASVWKELLGIQQVGIHDNFYELGGDSIKALQVSSRLYKAGLAVDVKDIFLHQTIEAIAAHIGAVSRIPDQTPVIGPVALTPIQQTFFEWSLPIPNHFNQAVLLTCPEDIRPGKLEAILSKLQEHHDMLRARFETREDGAIIQFCAAPNLPVALNSFDLSTRENHEDEIERIADEVQKSLNLEQNLWAVVHFKLAASARLLIVVHHLIVDGISWRILLEDLSTLFFQSERNATPDLSLKTDSFRVWAQELMAYAKSDRFLEEKAYWKALELEEVQVLEREKAHPHNHYQDEDKVIFALSEEDTRHLLYDVHKVFQTEINDVLLAGLSMAVNNSFGLEKLAIALEGHGRENVLDKVDVQRTIGWFTSLFPVVLEYDAEKDTISNIQNTRNMLRSIPNKGIGYGILKYLSPEALKQDVQFRLKPQISFNYLGQIDNDGEQHAFKIAPESVGQSVDGFNHRVYDFEISGMISEKRLNVGITYNHSHFHRTTIQQFADNYLLALKTCIHACLPNEMEETEGEDFTTKNIPKLNLNKLNKIFG